MSQSTNGCHTYKSSRLKRGWLLKTGLNLFQSSYFFNKSILFPYRTQNSFRNLLKFFLNGHVLFCSGLFWFNVMETQLTLKVEVEGLVVQSCLTLWDMNCSPPGTSVHGILQARILEWVSSHSLLQGIFLTQGSNPGLPHCRRVLYCLSPQMAHASFSF